VRWAVKLHPSIDGWLQVCKKIRHGPERWLVCPPLEYRWGVIRLLHEMLAHAGIEQTLAFTHLHFHWGGIKSDISKYIKCCDACQRQRMLLPDLPELQEPEIYGPFMHTHIDLAGPFLHSVSGGQARKYWVIIIMDYYTRVAEFVPTTSKEAVRIAQLFDNEWICRYGVPEQLTSDNGTEVAAEFTHMLARLAINHIRTSVAHPSANGAAERLVQTMKRMLSRHVNDHPNAWLQSLSHIRMA